MEHPEMKIHYMDGDIVPSAQIPVYHNYVYDEAEINPDMIYNHKKSENPEIIARYLLKPMYCKVINKQLIKELLINFIPSMRYDLKTESVEFFSDTNLYNIIVEIDINHVNDKDIILDTVRTILPGLTDMKILNDGPTFISYEFYKDDELVLDYQLELDDHIYYKYFNFKY